jgi:hypothetical protein
MIRTLVAVSVLVMALPLSAQLSTDTRPTTGSTPDTPGTSNNSILPGAGTVPALQERRPTPRDPRYRPPVSVPGLKEPSNPAALYLFSGDVDAQKFMDSRNKQKKASRYDEADYDDLPAGGRERVWREKEMLRQFGVDHFPYAGPEQEEPESDLRRFQIVFFISLPITAAASYGLFRAAKGQSAGGFSRGETMGVFALGLGLSGAIGAYDYYQNHLTQRSANVELFHAAVTFRF